MINKVLLKQLTIVAHYSEQEQVRLLLIIIITIISQERMHVLKYSENMKIPTVISHQKNGN